MKTVHSINNNIDIDSIKKSSDNNIWYNRFANNTLPSQSTGATGALNNQLGSFCKGAWQTLGFVEENGVYGLKIFTLSSSGEWIDAHVLNSDAESADSPYDNFILLTSNPEEIRYKAIWTDASTFKGKQRGGTYDNGIYKPDSPLQVDTNYILDIVSGGCLHVIFYDKGDCLGLGHTVHSMQGTPRKTPGIYYMGINFFTRYERYSNEDTHIYTDVFVKNFDYLNSAINDQSGDFKGLSPWKNHWLVAPVFNEFDYTWMELAMDTIPNEFSTATLDYCIVKNNPMDHCTLDVAYSMNLEDVQGIESSTFGGDFFQSAAHRADFSLMFSFLADLGSPKPIKNQRICHTYAPFLHNAELYNGKRNNILQRNSAYYDDDPWGPLITGVTPWRGMVNSSILSWNWGHSRTDLNFSRGIMQDDLIPNSLGAVSTGVGALGAKVGETLNPLSWFGVLSGQGPESSSWIDPNKQSNPEIQGFPTNHWSAFSGMSHVSQIGTAMFQLNGLYEASDTNPEKIYHSSLVDIMTRLPQAMLCIEQTNSYDDLINENGNVGEIFGFDYAKDPRETASIGFYTYIASTVGGLDESYTNEYYAKRTCYINSFISEELYGGVNFGDSDYIYDYMFNLSTYNNPFISDIVSNKIVYNNLEGRRALQIDIPEWSNISNYSTNSSDIYNQYSEPDGNYVNNTSSFDYARGATGKVSIAVMQQSIYTEDREHGDGFVSSPDGNINTHNDCHIFISYITDNNFYEGSSFSEMSNRDFHSYHKNEELMESGAGRNIRLIKLVYKADEMEYDYASELLNFGVMGKIQEKGVFGDYKFGVWDDCRLEAVYTGDYDAEWIDESELNPQDYMVADERIQSNKYLKYINLYAYSNCAGGFLDSTDGYNLAVKHSLNIYSEEQQEYEPSHMFEDMDYFKNNSKKQILYDLGGPDSKIHCIINPHPKDYYWAYTQGMTFENLSFLNQTTLIGISLPPVIKGMSPINIVSSDSVDIVNTANNKAHVLNTWHNYNQYIYADMLDEDFLNLVRYDSIQSFNILKTNKVDRVLQWISPSVSYTTADYGDSELIENFRVVNTVPTSYTIVRDVNPIFNHNFNTAEVIKNEYAETGLTPGQIKSVEISEEPNVNYYYAIRMNFELPVTSWLEGEGEIEELPLHKFSGIPSLTNSFQDIKSDFGVDSYQVESSSKYAAMEVSEDKVHVGLGSTVSDNPKWSVSGADVFL